MDGLVTIRRGKLTLFIGDPQGKDAAHELIATWPGWRRNPAAGTVPGGDRPCSIYSAAPWSSSIVSLMDAKAFKLTFEEGLLQRLQVALYALEQAKVELNPPASHSAPLEWRDEWKRDPMPHQRQAIRALKHLHYRALLSDDMGLGKTATALWCWQQAACTRVLIICPKTVIRNWAREIHATFTVGPIYTVVGTPKHRADEVGYIRHWMSDPGEGQRGVVLINYDLLHRLPSNEIDVLAEWAKGQFLILDESHYVKNRKAKRTGVVFDNFAPAHGGATFRLALTGTPVRNTLEDLWAQVQLVRPHVWSSFAQFDKFHLIRVATTYDIGEDSKGNQRKTTQAKVRGVRDREKLAAVINTLQVRRKKEDVLDLPPKVFTYPEFELDPRTAKIYAKMRDFAIIELDELEDGESIFSPRAKSALEATMRLEQIAQGFLGGIPDAYLEGMTPLLAKSAVKIEGRPGEVIFPDSAKIQWLMETIETIILQGGRPVIFSRFNAPMFWLVKQYPDGEMLHGGLTLEKRDDIIERFRTHGVPVLFCQVKLAEGWNATASQDAIFLGRDWSPAVNAQAADRLHRIGQKGTVNVQVPIVVGTFEVYLHGKLAAKQADTDVALQSMTISELRNAI